MRRADRLFQIVQHLRARRLTTAAQLSGWLQVSQRTIYRDIRDLSVSGVPVAGEAGVGYRVDRNFDLAPLMFTSDEVEAIVAGLRMTEAFAGPSLRLASRSALSKVVLALPKERQPEVERSRLFAPGFHLDPRAGERVDIIRAAIVAHRKLEIAYEDSTMRKSQRVLRPVALYFWGAAWTLAAWCECREDFRSFRLDRIQRISVSNETFAEEPGKSLSDFLTKVGAE